MNNLRAMTGQELPSVGYGQSGNSTRALIAAATAPSSVNRSVRLLVVDDHHDTLRAMTRLFTIAGYSVRGASDAESALEAVAQESFDVVISDLGLCGMDGYDLMRKVRKQCAAVGIAVSGHGMPADIEKSHDAGFAEHFVKPVDFTAILNAVARVIALRDGATVL